MTRLAECTQLRVPLEHSRRWVVCALLVALCALLAHEYFLGFRGLYGLFGNGVDAVVYRHGGETVLGPEALYTFSLFDTELPFTYPPFAAVVFVVLAALPVTATVAAVGALNCVLLYLAVLLSWRMLGYRGRNTHLVSVGTAIAMTWLEPVRMTVWLGQINLLLLVLVLWDLGRPEGSRLRGVGVGVAAGLKLTPAFFVVLALSLKQYRTAALATATFLMTIAVGFLAVFDDARMFWTSAIFQSDRIGMLTSPANQSVHGLLARFWSDGSPPAALWMSCSAVVACLGLWAAVVARRRGAHLLSLTMCGVATPMVSPFSWGHHWVWCVPLTVLALDYARRANARWTYCIPVLVSVPFIAWYYTAPSGIAVIGTFMIHGPAWLHLVVTSAYAAVFVVLIGAVLLVSRASVADGTPRLELAVERQRRMRWAGGWKSQHPRRSRQAVDMAQEAALGLRPVEEDSVDRAVSA